MTSVKPIAPREDDSFAKPLTPPAAPGRLISIDALRGLTIAFMILVNNGYRVAYAPLRHAEWNGWTPTDIVFPTFIFLMGVAIVLSTESKLRRGASRRDICIQVLRRSAILFFLGLVVNGFPFFNLHTLRIYGVLQRIALCYLFSGLLHLYARDAKSKIILLLVTLVGYWVLVRWVPIPGLGTPGKDVPFMDMRANLPAYVDRLLFPHRLYRGVRDPEGLLGTIPAIGTTLIGMLTGLWLSSRRSGRSKVIVLFLGGIFGILLGYLWSLSFPINKNMWTSSFVLLAAGISLLLLAMFYYSLELTTWSRRWCGSLMVFGTNAILAYVFSELFASALNAIRIHGISLKALIYNHFFGSWHSAKIDSVAYAAALVLLCWVFTFLFYRQNIFIKI